MKLAPISLLFCIIGGALAHSPSGGAGEGTSERPEYGLHEPGLDVIEHAHGHKHWEYRELKGEYVKSKNYLGLALGLVAGGLGSLVGVFGGNVCPLVLRSFSTGILLSLVIVHMFISSNVILQEGRLPEDLSHFISLASGLVMLFCFIAHFLDYAYQSSQHKTSAYLVHIALVIHSINTGTTVGMRPDVDTNSYLAAFFIQHFLYGLALGMAVVDANFLTYKIPTLLIFTFTAACPLATLVGILYHDHKKDIPSTLFEGMSEASAAGLLCYVVFVNMLSRSFSFDYAKSTSTMKSGSLGALYSGVIVIAVLAHWAK